MKPIRTLNEARALAAARRRQEWLPLKLAQEHIEARKKWRAPFALTRNIAAKIMRGAS